ncbi:MAG: DUF2804 domain-containing protein [Myxococcales bacterium]
MTRPDEESSAEHGLVKLAHAPSALCDAQGTPLLGRYAGRVGDLDTSRWDGSRGLFSRRRTQRKTWIFMGAFSARFMVGFAVVDAGLLGTAFCYVFDRERRQLWEDKLSRPLGFGAQFRGGLDVSWRLERGRQRFAIEPGHGADLLVRFEGTSSQGKRPFALELSARRAGPGMSTIAASDPARPFNHTYKACDLACTLKLDLAGEQHTLEAPGMLDFTLGYPPRRTFWNWAAGNGSAEGAQLGFNLVAHFNQGLENALWLDDQLIPVGQVRFTYDATDLAKPWLVESDDGAFSARFEPDGQRAENIQALVLGSRFVQLFGRYRGALKVGAHTRDFSAFGVVEEHHALW